MCLTLCFFFCYLHEVVVVISDLMLEVGLMQAVACTILNSFVKKKKKKRCRRGLTPHVCTLLRLYNPGAVKRVDVPDPDAEPLWGGEVRGALQRRRRRSPGNQTGDLAG